jgi:hypothetical protein
MQWMDEEFIYHDEYTVADTDSDDEQDDSEEEEDEYDNAFAFVVLGVVISSFYRYTPVMIFFPCLLDYREGDLQRKKIVNTTMDKRPLESES